MSPVEFKMREKDRQRFSEKIEQAVNCLSLEGNLNMPDFIIAEMMVSFFEATVIAKKWSDHWKKSDSSNVSIEELK